jgi:RNA polymerase sigma-70 factor, ECF subfamily
VDRRSSASDDPEQQALLRRYLEAFERYDMDALRDAALTLTSTQSMPPFELWLRGRDEVIGWMLGPGAKCRRFTGPGGRGQRGAGVRSVAPRLRTVTGTRPWAVHVLDLVDGTVTAIGSFLDVDTLFPRFGLPLRLPAGAPLPVQP